MNPSTGKKKKKKTNAKEKNEKVGVCGSGGRAQVV
jgi:hypothetical protein